MPELPTPTGSRVDLTEASVRQRGAAALHGVSLRVAPGSIVGVLGLPGAGPSTLLEVLAGYRRPTTGGVLIDGEAPFEHPRLMSDTCLVGAGRSFGRSRTVRQVLALAERLRPSWDADLAHHLSDRFFLPRTAKVGALNRDQSAALAATIGLASHAPLTLFDETTAALDADGIAVFCEELAADHRYKPRTMILAMATVDRSESLLSDVVVLDAGRLVLAAGAAELGEEVSYLSGPAGDIEFFVRELRVVAVTEAEGHRTVTLAEPLDAAWQRAARALGLTAGPVPLAVRFAQLTGAQPVAVDDRTAPGTGPAAARSMQPVS